MSKRKSKKTKAAHRDAPWTPWVLCTRAVIAGLDVGGIPADIKIMRNNHYQVDIHPMNTIEPFGKVVWLSIKRIDRAPIHDWRDLQRIKTELLGPEIEAVELYPAESRVTDSANQFHLWCFVDGYALPFGYTERIIVDTDHEGAIPGSGQRPFRGHMRPDDAISTTEVMARYDADPSFGTRGIVPEKEKTK